MKNTQIKSRVILKRQKEIYILTEFLWFYMYAINYERYSNIIMKWTKIYETHKSPYCKLNGKKVLEYFGWERKTAKNVSHKDVIYLQGNRRNVWVCRIFLLFIIKLYIIFLLSPFTLLNWKYLNINQIWWVLAWISFSSEGQIINKYIYLNLNCFLCGIESDFDQENAK